MVSFLDIKYSFLISLLLLTFLSCNHVSWWSQCLNFNEVHFINPFSFGKWCVWPVGEIFAYPKVMKKVLPCYLLPVILYFTIRSLTHPEWIFVLCYVKGITDFLKKDCNDYIEICISCSHRYKTMNLFWKKKVSFRMEREKNVIVLEI